MNLLACPTCHRQYDVTRLEPGGHVRCACDAILEVGFRSPLPVEALCCNHCGGRATPEDGACTFCGSALSCSDRGRSTLCPHCLTRLEDDSQHCKRCGVAVRPQALSPLPVNRACGRCEGELRIRSLARESVIECAACGGLWVETDTFRRLCQKSDVPARDFEQAPARPDPVRYLPCLRCEEMMFRRLFHDGGRTSTVVIDACSQHGVWLDPDELEKIARFLNEPTSAHTRTGSPEMFELEGPPVFSGLPLGVYEPPTAMERIVAFLGELLG